MIKFILLLSAVQLFSSAFTSKPQITDQGQQVKIDFTVSAVTDVSVFIVDLSGKTVCHLASGVLGPKAPAPFSVNSLTQTVYWNKTDDQGNPFPGAYKVQIGLGLRANSDGFPGQNKDYELFQTGGQVKGMVADPSGNIIVRMNGGRGNPRILKMTHDAKYIQTIVPYASNKPEDQLRGFGRVSIPGGKFMPLVYESRHGTVIPELFGGHESGIESTRGGMVYLPDGRIAVANATFSGSYYLQSGSLRRFLIINDDGTCPRDSVFGPYILTTHGGANTNDGEIYAAVSPDGQSLYATGMMVRATTSVPYSIIHSVYRSSLTDRAMQPFLGSGVSGGDNTHFNQPRGIATDANGRIYVSDFGNNRVVIFDSTGAYINQFAVTGPDKIHLHPVTGEIYLTSLSAGLVKIIKFSAYPACASLYSMSFTWDNKFEPQFCLNPYVTPCKLYYNTPTYQSLVVNVITDGGTSFSSPAGWFNTAVTDGLSNGFGYDYVECPGYLTVDPADTLLYAGAANKWSKINLKTGAVKKTNLLGMDMAFGQDGYLYGYGKTMATYYDSVMRRYEATWAAETQRAFAGGAMEFNTITNRFPGPHTLVGGMYVDRNGQMYIHSYGLNGAGDSMLTTVYNPDGTVKTHSLLSAPERNIAGGLQVDKNGNIFTMFHAKPKGMLYPDLSIFTGPYFPNPLLSGENWAWGQQNMYAWSYGSLFKFPPSGGAFAKRALAANVIAAMPDENLNADTVPKTQVNGFYKTYVWDITGPTRQYYGISPTVNFPGGHDKCQCITGRLGMDKFGRIYAPDILRFNVVMLDNNLNEIGRFGEYGNLDQDGTPDSRHPDPFIPLCFPAYVQAAGEHVYISDPGNHRIARVKFDYATLFTGDTVISGSIERTLGGRSPLLSVYPQPFNPEVNFVLNIKTPSLAEITIHTVDGTLIASPMSRKQVKPGILTIKWNGRDSHNRSAGTGVYFARTVIDGKIHTHKVSLLK